MPKRWVADDWNWVVTNGQVYRIITIKELFIECIADPALFASLVADFDGTLQSRHYVLYKKCYDTVKALLDLFKQGKPIVFGSQTLTSAEVQAWIKNAVKWLAWKTRTMKSSICPWDDCPPVLQKKRR